MAKRDWFGTALVAVLISLIILLSKPWAAPVLGATALILAVLIVFDWKSRTRERKQTVNESPWISAKRLDNKGMISGPGQIVSEDLMNEGTIQNGPGFIFERNEVERGQGSGTAVSIEGPAQGITFVGNKFLGFDKVLEVINTQSNYPDEEVQ